MQIAFAITCHSIQGATIKEEYCIHEVDRMMKSGNKKLLYTAVTRGIDLNDIHFYKGVPNPPKNFNSNDFIKLNYIDMSDDEEFNKFDKVERL